MVVRCLEDYYDGLLKGELYLGRLVQPYPTLEEVWHLEGEQFAPYEFEKHMFKKAKPKYKGVCIDDKKKNIFGEEKLDITKGNIYYIYDSTIETSGVGYYTFVNDKGYLDYQPKHLFIALKVDVTQDIIDEVIEEYVEYEEEEIMKEDKKEMVEHPSHYNQGKYEVIDVIDDWKLGFSLGNAIKYIARAGHKWETVEDLKKAIFYIQHEIDKLEKEKK